MKYVGGSMSGPIVPRAQPDIASAGQRKAPMNRPPSLGNSLAKQGTER
jgi:hypothetical protein